MPGTCRAAAGRRLAGAVVVAASLLLSSPEVALAAYGPPVPPVAPVPGGFSEIVTSQTVGEAGKLMTHLNLAGLAGSLLIRPGTFLTPVQVTVTEPFLKESISTTAYSTTADAALPGECGTGTGIGDAGFRGYCAVGGAGILVQINGIEYPGRYFKPMVLRFSWKPKISEFVVRWNGHRFVVVKSAVTRHHRAKVLVHRDSDYLVLRRIPAHSLTASTAGAGLTTRWRQALSMLQALSIQIAALSR
jgi:hypothetical protein